MMTPWDRNVGTSVSSLFGQQDNSGFRKLTSGRLPERSRPHSISPRTCNPASGAGRGGGRRCRPSPRRVSQEAEAFAFCPRSAQRMLCQDKQKRKIRSVTEAKQLLFAVAQTGVETDRGSVVREDRPPTWPPPNPAT